MTPIYLNVALGGGSVLLGIVFTTLGQIVAARLTRRSQREDRLLAGDQQRDDRLFTARRVVYVDTLVEVNKLVDDWLPVVTDWPHDEPSVDLDYEVGVVKADLGTPLAIVGSPAVSAGFEALITAWQDALQDGPLSDPDKAERVRSLIESLRDDLREAMRADLGADR